MGSKLLNSAELIGNSPFCRTIREQVPFWASSDLPILIIGPTGTGKDVIARMIHAASKRADKTYLSMNCATLGNLAESELFGHASGAFTGAVRGTRGYIGSADGGTLLLDEVGELVPEVQAKMLRFLDNGEYFRVGEASPRHANVRIIAATNQDLEILCKEKRFREDLYYRLCGIVIRTAPLSERLEDIPQLVHHFMQLYANHYNQQQPSITPEALSALAACPWPGNVRQLKHTVFRLCHFARKNTITPEQVKANTHDTSSVFALKSPEQLPSYKEAKKMAIAEFDRRYFTALLRKTGGSLKEILAISGMHKKNFYMKLKELGLNPKDFRKASK